MSEVSTLRIRFSSEIPLMMKDVIGSMATQIRLIWGFEQRYVAILSPVLGDGGFTADDQGTTVNDEPVAGARSPHGKVGFSVTVVVAGHRDVAS